MCMQCDYFACFGLRKWFMLFFEKSLRKVMEQQLTRAIVEELYSSANEKVLEIRGDSPTSHFALLRLTCRNKEEFIEWFHNHQSMTGVTFRVKNVRPFKGITIVYKAEFRCQHNTYPDSHKSRNYRPSKQHTGCESTMKVTIKSSVEGRRVRSQDDLRGDYPTIVQVNHNHNHEIKLEDYKGPWRKSRIRRKCSKASPTPPYDSPLVSIVDAREGFTLVKCENPSDPVTTILELPDTVQLLEEPSATTLFVENTHDNICFISQDGEVCYNWKEADNVITNVTTTLANLLKSSFLSHPSQVMDALKRFQDGVNSIETESELFGALHNFGGRQTA